MSAYVSKALIYSFTVTVVEGKIVESYKITYNANGGSGTMPAGEAKAGEAFTLPECTFGAPEGQEFSGKCLAVCRIFHFVSLTNYIFFP